MYFLRIGGYEMNRLWTQAAAAGRKALALLGLYLDDLLLVGGGGCIVSGVDTLAGHGWATVACGGLLIVYALVVARSRRGGRN